MIVLNTWIKIIYSQWLLQVSSPWTSADAFFLWDELLDLYCSCHQLLLVCGSVCLFINWKASSHPCQWHKDASTTIVCCPSLLPIFNVANILCRLYLNSWSHVLFTDLGDGLSWVWVLALTSVKSFCSHLLKMSSVVFWGIVVLLSCTVCSCLKRFKSHSCNVNRLLNIYHYTFSLTMSSFICIEISLDLILKLALDGYSKTTFRINSSSFICLICQKLLMEQASPSCQSVSFTFLTFGVSKTEEYV